MKSWLALLKNDVKLFVRAPGNIWAMLLFGLLVLIVFHFSLPVELGKSTFMGSSALMMSLLFSSVLGLPPLQHHPSHVRFLPQLLTGNLSSVGYYWEKLTAGLGILLLNSLVLYPVTIVLFDLPLSDRLLTGYLFMGLGLVGITVVVTLASALTVGRENWLLPVLAFPLLFPVVLATSRLIEGAVSSRTNVPESWVHLLVAYDLLMVFGSWFLAEFLWDELPEVG